MKSFKSFLLILFMATSMVAHAQTTLRDAFKAFVEACPSATNMTPETMGPALKQMNISVMANYDEEKSNQLVEKYLNEKLLDHIIDAMLPYLEKYVTAEDLKLLTEQMQTPQGQLFQAHQSAFNAKFNQFTQLGKDLAAKIISGETPAPIEPVACPDSYKQLFLQYFEESNLMDSMSPFFDSIGGAQLNDTQKEMMNKMKQYFSDNMSTIYLNESYGTMTEDDLRFGLQYYKSNAWKNEMKAMGESMSHAQEMGMGVVMSYLNWLKGQGVETNI